VYMMLSRHRDVKVNVWTWVPLIVVSTALHYRSSGAVCRHVHWRRSAVKYGWSGSVRSSHQTLSALRKFSFTFHFWHKSFILDDMKLAELCNNSCCNEIMQWRSKALSGPGSTVIWGPPFPSPPLPPPSPSPFPSSSPAQPLCREAAP